MHIELNSEEFKLLLENFPVYSLKIAKSVDFYIQIRDSNGVYKVDDKFMENFLCAIGYSQLKRLDLNWIQCDGLCEIFVKVFHYKISRNI